MKIQNLPINVPRSQLNQFCQRYHIRKLSLFGSVLRNDFTNESDVDILVEFRVGKIPGLMIVSIEEELSQLLKRDVDLRTPAELSRYFRNRVLEEAVVIYDQD